MKTQTISRKSLEQLNKVACAGWQTKIKEVIAEQVFEDVISVKEDLILQAYSEADKSQKKLIEKLFTLPKSTCDEINNFDDILRLGNTTLADILPWSSPKTKEQRSQNALAKIQLATKVYNGDTILDWKNTSQYKYYPYFIKQNGQLSLDDVYYIIFSADAAFGCHFKSEELCRDFVKKFMDIYLDYLPE